MTFARSALLAALVGCLASLPAARGASAADRWVVYVNDRYGTTVSYPAPRFAMQPPPANDDGRTLIAADGAEILAFAAYNALDETLASRQASLNGPDYARTTYRAKGANWFVVSGHSRHRRRRLRSSTRNTSVRAAADHPQPRRHLSRRAQGALRPDRRSPRRARSPAATEARVRLRQSAVAGVS